MKATIDQDGLMKIIPETEIEAYALHQWAKQNFVGQERVDMNESGFWRGSGMVVSPAYPQPSGDQERS